jgi:hypothetical protein
LFPAVFFVENCAGKPISSESEGWLFAHEDDSLPAGKQWNAMGQLPFQILLHPGAPANSA